MATALPWITLLLGFLLGLLIYHIITIGKRQDQAAYVEGLETDLRTARADLAACGDEMAQLKADYKEQVTGLRAEVKAHAQEIKTLGADLEARVATAEASAAELAECRAAAEVLQAEISSLKAAGTARTESVRSRTVEVETLAPADDLTEIKGIGPALAARLAEAGILRYADLAASDPADLPEVLGLQPWQQVDPVAWVDEAERLAARPPQVHAGDDLTILEGIGPTYATRLRAAGIISFAQLAEAAPDTIAVIIGAPAWRRMNYEDWIAQARLAAVNDEAGLAALQEQLFKRQGDNLTLIAGVGPQSLAILDGAGIHTYAALASATPEQLADLFSDADMRAGDFKAWIAEAKLRAAGKRIQRTRTRTAELQGTQSRSCPQDLAQVMGVGTVYEQRLFDAGVGSFWELGMLSEEILTELLQVEDFQDVDLAAMKTDALRLAEETGTMGHTWDGSEPDDFEILEEIGQVLERRLYAAGICTYEALAQATVEELERICRLPAFQKPDYGRWIAQARARSKSA